MQKQVKMTEGISLLHAKIYGLNQSAAVKSSVDIRRFPSQTQNVALLREVVRKT